MPIERLSWPPPTGRRCRAAAEAYARAALAGRMAEDRPWEKLLAAVKGRGAAVAETVEAQAAAELELTSRRDQPG